MKIIAITGGIASGKTTVAEMLHKKYNIPIIDTDKIAREVISLEIKNKIIKKFGNHVIQNNLHKNTNTNTDLELDRKKIRELIFEKPKERAWLENLLHPLINKRVQLNIKEYSNKNYLYIIVLIPLLTKKYLEENKYIDYVVVVDCDRSVQVKRASKRDGSDQAQINKIIDQQINRQERLELADLIINNNYDEDNDDKNISLIDLQRKVDKLHDNIINECIQQ